MPITVDDYRALLSGQNLNGYRVGHKPVFVTYSFDEAPDNAARGLYPSSFLNSFSAFTSRERDVASSALRQWGDASGLTFLQVAPGHGTIRFGNYDLSRSPENADAAGFAYEPGLTVSKGGVSEDPYGSDIFIDQGVRDYSTSDMQHVLIHEIGHAIGLKHPYEGSVVLDPSLDNTSETVMSYNGYAPDLGPLDRQAAAFLYGPGSSDGRQDSYSHWDPSRELLVQEGTYGANVIVGISTRDKIAAGPGDDVLYGGSGADILMGGRGDDSLTGGAGRDRFVFNQPLGTDNVDRIRDFVSGVDRISLSDFVFAGLHRGQLSDQNFTMGDHAGSAAPTIGYDASSGSLWYDADGSGTAKTARQFAQAQPGLHLSASDFHVF